MPPATPLFVTLTIPVFKQLLIIPLLLPAKAPAMWLRLALIFPVFMQLLISPELLKTKPESLMLDVPAPTSISPLLIVL